MRSTILPRAVAFTFIALLAACGGGGGGVTPVTTGPSQSGSAPTPRSSATPTVAPTSSPQSMGTAQLQIAIPSLGPSTVRRRATVSISRKPLYVSLGTQAAAVWINGTPVDPKVIQVVCNLASASQTVCTFTIPAPAGNDTFRVALGDSNGDILSEGTTEAQIVAGEVTLIHITFLGVPTHVVLKLDNASPPVGKSATAHLTAVAYDPMNNVIGGDTYFTPVTVSNDDKSGQVSMSGSQFTNPSDSITITYSGKLISSVTFSVVSPSSAQNVATVFSPTPYQSFATSYQTYQVARGPDGNAWFTECAGNVGPCKIGKITPDGQLTESTDVRGAQALTAGPDGNIWFTENTFPYVAKITPAMQITEYQTKTLAPNEGYYAGPIVTGPDKNLWFMELRDLAQFSPAGQIIKRIPVSGADWSRSMVVGSDGNFWIAGLGQILRVTPTESVSSYVIGSLTGLLQSNLTLGPDAHIYFEFNGFYKIAMDGTIVSITTTPSTLRFGGPFTLGPGNTIWGLAATTDQYSSSPAAGAASLAIATNALTIYPLGMGSPGTGQYSAAWDSANDLWLPTGSGTIVRFRYDP